MTLVGSALLNKLFNAVALRNAITAITTTSSETAITSAILGKMKEAFVVLNINTADDGDADETYVFTIQGRVTAGSGTYLTLGTYTHTRGLTGCVLMSCDKVLNDMRVTLTVGGTSPSCIYQALLVGKAIYEPAGAGVLA